MEVFPVNRERRPKKARFIQEVEICKCRMPTMKEDMLEYSKCKNWFYVSCVNAPQSVLDDKETVVLSTVFVVFVLPQYTNCIIKINFLYHVFIFLFCIIVI